MHFLHHTFQDRRKKPCVNSAAYYTIIKNQFAAPLEVMHIPSSYGKVLRFRHAFIPWLYLHKDFPKLASATTLLFVTITGIGHLAYRFPIRNAWLYKLHFQLMVVFY